MERPCGGEVKILEQHSKREIWSKASANTSKEHWFLVALPIVIIVAFQVQVQSSQQALKTDIIAYLNVAVTFLITGCTLDMKILIAKYARWKVHLFVQVEIFLVISTAVFGLVEAIATDRTFLDPGLPVGLIFMSCMSTTMASNVVMTRQAHGNQELTAVQTTVGNLFGAFVTPALVIMYTSVPVWYDNILPPYTGCWGGIYGNVLKRLGLSLFLPLIVRQILRWFFPTACMRVFTDWKLSKVGSLALLVMLWQTFDTAFASDSFTTVPGYNMVFIVSFSIGLYLFLLQTSFVSSLMWLSKEDVVAVTYCVRERKAPSDKDGAIRVVGLQPEAGAPGCGKHDSEVV
ncbi:hypothetical protein K431DRAFT_229776 [Polychaeton citri CBS 116435]|uniref:Sodium bile acid symporter family protein n=1 Tax=Polychaeton citri CBS 116435 TaxID=1314669 RepID=A0A9P4Q401_9PEZI|nr:hypothetical protein K431DRAFT_229776 [Polychaeton citri CBS 116435]